MQFASFTRRLRGGVRAYFITGVLVIVPLWLTWSVLAAIVKRVDRILAILPKRFQPDTLLPIHIPGLGVIFTILIIQLVGMLSANLIGRAVMGSFERFLGRIPLVRGLYITIKQFLEQIISVDAGRFRRVVLLRYPTEGTYRIGFVTGESITTGHQDRPHKLLHLFLPNSPNAATGLFFVVDEEQTIATDMTPEQAFKLIMSVGLVGGRFGTVSFGDNFTVLNKDISNIYHGDMS